MATITIKIDSEQLAREVLTQLGYLPDKDDAEKLFYENLPWTDSEDDEPEVPKPELKKPVSVVRLMETLPESTRNIPVPKQGEFCTTEDPKEDGVEPETKEIGAPLAVVYSPDKEKESDALYQQCMEVRKSIPPAAERLKAQADQLLGDELLGYLDAMCEHEDKDMREAAKAMVRKEFAGHTLKMWPTLQKIIDNA